MTKGKVILFMLALFLISGCSTPYQPEGYSGGYSETRILEDLYLVSFQGNRFTSKEKVESFLLLRAAEITVENDFSHFTIIGGGVEKKSEDITVIRSGQTASLPAPSGTGGVGAASAYGRPPSESRTPISYYGGTLRIKLFHRNDKLRNKPSDKTGDQRVYDAKEVINNAGKILPAGKNTATEKN